ncbi:MAG: hypothetical protein H7X99_05190, partial [Saprospiraceae bacterium]|nr:hypothetical protein [Saprospiraceae bacterium]
MIADIRDQYNKKFTQKKYQTFLDGIEAKYHCKPLFRVGESPLFIPKLLKERLLEACDLINEVVLRKDIKSITQAALYDECIIVPGEDDHTTFLQMDFGVCLDELGDPMPQLIEIQGFPSVYFFQYMVSEAYKQYFEIPDGMTCFFNDMNSVEYKQMMKDIIVGDTDPKQVVLLEIEPEKQTTYIDMLSTSVELGIPVVCITKVIKKGKQLFYK